MKTITSSLLFFFAVVASIVASMLDAYYVPGIAPVAYGKGDPVPVLANGLHSLSGVAPYRYYVAPFCRPPIIETNKESLGQILMGDRFETSPYTFKMQENQKCEVLKCENDQEISNNQLQILEKLIEADYRGYLVIDNLPTFNNGSLVYFGKCLDLPKAQQYEFLRGYALGVRKKCTGKDTLVNNHLDFQIQYHVSDEGEDQFMVVGFTARPMSIDWNGKACNGQVDIKNGVPEPLSIETAKARKKISWTYSVTWVEEPTIKWASRWDSYLHTSFADTSNRVHWTSIIFSIAIVLAMALLTLMLLVRSLRRDFAKLNAVLASLESEENAEEEIRWKRVRLDALRPPPYVEYLIILVASGVQILGMTIATLAISLYGVLSPANRGGLIFALILMFVLLAFVAGYVAAWLSVEIHEKSWKIIFGTATFIPGVCFFTLLSANHLYKIANSSSVLPFKALFLIFFLWIGGLVPLTILGASLGFNAPLKIKEKLRAAARASDPRPIPVQPEYLHDVVCYILPGVIPLAPSLVEIRFILASLWQGMVYYVFGFLGCVVLLCVISASLAAVTVVYHRLSAENYEWWWVSVLAPSGSGVFLVFYFTYYFFAYLSIEQSLAATVYFLYMGNIALLYVVALAAVGFFPSYWFVLKLYDTDKAD